MKEITNSLRFAFSLLRKKETEKYKVKKKYRKKLKFLSICVRERLEM